MKNKQNQRGSTTAVTSNRKPSLKKDTSEKCCLCGDSIRVDQVTGWTHGKNASPFNGRCCNMCEGRYVFPARAIMNEISDRAKSDKEMFTVNL